MNNHEKLIRQIAEKMARERFPSAFKSPDPEYSAIAISEMGPLARIAVKHMADVVIHALEQDYGPYEPVSGDLIHDWLTERGLIPEAGKEAAGDESKNS